MTLALRYMRMSDIPQVVMIDQLSFDPPWSARSYSFEVSESNYSHMLVLFSPSRSRAGGGCWGTAPPLKTAKSSPMAVSGISSTKPTSARSPAIPNTGAAASVSWRWLP
jgi:hypothetical protein